MEHVDRSGFLCRTTALAWLVGVAACNSAAPPPERVAATSSALTIGGLFATGVDGTGAAIAAGTVDPHYTLSSNDPTFSGPDALAVEANSAWTDDTATSSWISIRATTEGATNDVYTYTTTFVLATNPTTATLSGSWAADDSVTLSLNGTTVAERAAEAYGSTTAFTVPAGSPFQVGNNTLAFVTVNSGGGPTGLQVTALSGSVAECISDAQCATGQFCNTETNACTATLANGIAVPTVAGHTPPLTGLCDGAVGTAVCASGVCDTGDNLCGYADGDGPCVAGAAPVCRSGECSVATVCEPAGGCESDGDCTVEHWCDESTTTCAAQLPNGAPVPTDAPHSNPALNGTCTVPAGTLVCASGVCDTDNDCGLADGDGPCTTVDGLVVCRSGACSTVGVCEPEGGCASDSDCTGGEWCDESITDCSAQLANGAALPVDAAHNDPTLDGECSPAAGALVCVSRVCDLNDNECGYANGDGSCDSTSAGVVCRSLACSVNGACEPAGGCNVDGDCTGATPDCDRVSQVCVAASGGGTGTGSTVTVTATGPTSVALTWTPTTDPNGVTTYDIYENGTLVATTTGGTLSTTLSGLDAGAPYTFSVQAADPEGASTSGPSTVFCTPADVCHLAGTFNAALGTCAPGASVSVDDGDACTLDTCDAVNGVLHRSCSPIDRTVATVAADSYAFL